jgi:hypothetical protein
MLNEHNSTAASIQNNGAQTSSDISTQDLLQVLKTLRCNYDLLLHHHFDSPVMGLFNVVSNLLEQLEQGLSTPVAKTEIKPVDPLNSVDLINLGLDLGLIRANCIALMHFCEINYHFNQSAFGAIDLNNNDAYLLSSNAVETATKWAKRLAEGGV